MSLYYSFKEVISFGMQFENISLARCVEQLKCEFVLNVHCVRPNEKQKVRIGELR